MKAAVIGLGVEGKKAVNSLLKHGWEVYATDLNINVDLSGLDLPMLSLNMVDENQTVSIVGDEITIDLGFTNPYAIEQCDAIAISPSMYGGAFATRLLEDGDLLSDVVSKHKDIFTRSRAFVLASGVAACGLSSCCSGALEYRLNSCGTWA